MHEKNAQREIQHIANDVVILTDTFFSEGEKAAKQKLVCLYPHQLSWTSTHLTGPNKYSQFFYQIKAENKNRSLLKFTALHLDHNIKEDTNDRKVESVAHELRETDSKTWRLLAREMEREVRKATLGKSAPSASMKERAGTKICP